VAWLLYHGFKESQENGNAIDLDDNSTTTIKVAILDNGHTVDLAGDVFWSDVSADEVAAGASYTAGGNAFTGRTVTLATGTVTFDGNDPAAWAQDGSGFTDGRYLVMYNDTGTPSTSRLIVSHDMLTDQSIVSGSLTVQYDAAGIFTKT
jgi:hypothetical protein